MRKFKKSDYIYNYSPATASDVKTIFVGFIALLVVALGIGLTIATICVAWHFIAKYW